MINFVLQSMSKRLIHLSCWRNPAVSIVVHNFCSSKQPLKGNEGITQLIRIMEQNEKKRDEKIKIKTMLRASVLFFCGAALYCGQKLDKRQQKQASQYRWDKLRKQYQRPFNESTFTHGKSIQNKMKSIFQSKTDILELILGVEGIGKTTAAQQLINKKRQNGQIVYYLNLRQEQQNSRDKQNSKIFQRMVQLIAAITQEYDKYSPPRKTTLVIDDINKLQSIEQKLDREQKQNKIIGLSKKGVKVILISSSTYFYNTVWKLEQFRKYTNKVSHVIWMMSEQQSKQILQKKGDKLSIQRIFVDKVASFGLPLRDSLGLLQLLIQEFPKQQEKLVMNWLDQQIRIIQTDLERKIDRIFNINTYDPECSYELIKGFTQNKQHFNVSGAYLKNCIDLEENIVKIKGQKFKQQISNTIDQFDKQNLIIMCYPRSRMIMSLFKEKLKSLEKLQNNN